MSFTPKTWIEYQGDGKTTTFAIPFPYLKRSFVTLLVDGIPQVHLLSYHFLSDTLLALYNAPATGSTIRIQRNTQSTPLVNWQDASVFTAANLTLAETQTLHVAEELSENASSGMEGDIYTYVNNLVNQLTPGVGGGGMGLYTTVEALKNIQTKLPVGTRVGTTGYFTPGDEGAATYRIAADTEGLPWAIPLMSGQYALITNTDFVTYRMFGAPLNGVEDDGPAMRNAHAYSHTIYNYDSTGQIKQYPCRVENHQGIIYKKDAEVITCYSDVDLSGSTLLVNDTNAAWAGIYMWGDVNAVVYDYEIPDDLKSSFFADNHVLAVPTSGDELPNHIILKLEETPYTARDDSGYLYTVARRELVVHDINGICSSPFTDDWRYAGGGEINCRVSDLANGGSKTQQMFTEFKSSYTYIPKLHGTFVGCDVILDMAGDKHCSVLWVKRHNAHVQGFTFRPSKDKLHNTKFKNAMVYIWDSYNVRVSNLQGFNAAGQNSSTHKGTSGYILRMTNVSDVFVEDCRLQGYWGATAMDSVKNVHFTRCHMNRLDVHDYFTNLYAKDCVFYNSSIQIGYGRGVASFTDCTFYWNYVPLQPYLSSHIVEFNCTYGRIFEGMVYINNCKVQTNSPPDNEFNIFKMEFSPEATSITKHFKFPEIVVKNLNIYSSNPDTHFAYFKILGTRKALTSDIRPSHVYGVFNDGTVRWQYIGRGIDWDKEVTAIGIGEILRVQDSFIDDDNKVQFYNRRYYICTQAGTLDFSGSKPTTTEDTEFTCGTAGLKYTSDIIWKPNYEYSLDDICIVDSSNWYPLHLYRCIAGGVSNGYFPLHTEGIELEGPNDPVFEPDQCWWEYVAPKFTWCKDWVPTMQVTAGQRILAEGRLYEVVRAGTLPQYPPYDTFWFGEHEWGTARLRFIGATWKPRAWYAKDSYCEARGSIYRLVNHDGTTLGNPPIKGNPYCVDGDIIWEYVSGETVGGGNTSGDTWEANTAYSEGASVISHGNTYRCVFDGRLTMPNKLVFEDITTNMNNGHIFWFYQGADIPTKQGNRPWEIVVRNCEGIDPTTAKGLTARGYFGHSGNPAPVITTDTEEDTPGVTVGDWIAPTFLNGWTRRGEGYSTPGFCKDSLGFVRIKGQVSSGTTWAGIFQLPVGYRPSEILFFSTMCNTGSSSQNAYTRIDPDGVVYANGGGNAWYTLDGIQFKV